jgi:putative flippase GtrA
MMRAQLLRIARFGAVGGAVTLLTYLVFLACIAMGTHYLVASLSAWAAGVVVGFIAHRSVTFDDRGAWQGQVVRYVGVYLLQLLFGTATLAALIDLAGLAPWQAYPVNVVFTATFSFVLMSVTVFVPKRSVLPG